ncbi:MAG TPA: T9SS type A sorting domain-containing protein [bacterium]|nr:T9SS type A sorting domain-containing protein [bacterium]
MPGANGYSVYAFNGCWVVNPGDYILSGDGDGCNTWSTFTLAERSAAITFVDGSGFTSSVVKGGLNQALGRFQLTGSASGATLTTASIKLDGTRTGLSNLKLWSSTNNTFESGSDTKLGSTVGGDPGDGGSVSFSSFSSSIGTGGTYYFLTGDVAAGATGIVQGVIVANGNLTISDGTLSGSIDNAPLSNGDASLPVELASFTASVQGNAVVLNWQTASETDNLGFILERAAGNGAWQPIASYKTNPALKGQGNASTTNTYSFTDNTVVAGSEYRYRLGDVNVAGTVTMHSPIYVTTTALPQSTVMLNAYPNPFNPETTIKYTLHKDAQVTITVYDLLGRQVKTLVDENQVAGAYHVIWNGTDAAGSQAASGAYLVRMETAEVTQTQKVLLLK